jgi:hypothetical protein
MKILKGKHILIKNNITREIDTTCGHIETLNTLMARAVAKKNALFGAES